MRRKTLLKVAKGQLTPEEAYQILYTKRMAKARFIKLHMIVKDHPWVSGFINFLFFLPFPIALGERIAFRAMNKKGVNIEFETFRELLGCCNGTEISVIADEANIRIDIF